MQFFLVLLLFNSIDSSCLLICVKELVFRLSNAFILYIPAFDNKGNQLQWVFSDDYLYDNKRL